MICGIKDIHTVRVGDTVMEKDRPLTEALPGYKEAKPVVFAGIFPIDQSEYTALKYALDKLNLEDSSFNYMADSSQALASATVWASWACCTWTSSRSDSRASSTST